MSSLLRPSEFDSPALHSLSACLAHALGSVATLTIERRYVRFDPFSCHEETSMETNTPTAPARAPSRQPAPIGDGVIDVSGEQYMRNAQGHLVPLALVKPLDKLQDETVRAIISFAIPLSEEVTRFKGHTYTDVVGFQELVAQEYKTSVGGKKGNVQLQSFNGLYKVELQVADQITFGPQVHAASALVDECLREWGATAGPQLKGLVEGVFNVGQAGEINKAALFSLLRLDIDDERWKRAMDALRDSIQVTGSKSYFRFYQRDDVEGEWQPITINIARA